MWIEAGHLPKWKEAEVIHGGLNKRKRNIIEAAYIATEKKNVNTADSNQPSSRQQLFAKRVAGRGRQLIRQLINIFSVVSMVLVFLAEIFILCVCMCLLVYAYAT